MLHRAWGALVVGGALMAGCSAGPSEAGDTAGNGQGGSQTAETTGSQTSAGNINTSNNTSNIGGSAGVGMTSVGGTSGVGVSSVGGASSTSSTATQSSSSGGMPNTTGASGATSQGFGGGVGTADCETLVSDVNVNWRESALVSDQEIVECLAWSLGRPVGFGERALGGYDPGGGSQLVVIEKRDDVSVEEQLLTAILGDEPTWIVFDKRDFADPTDVALYRAYCDDASVQAALGATAQQCRDHEAWCAERGYQEQASCLEQFFNTALNDGDLPIRNPVIGSNKTIDGRSSNAHFLFSGFAIGSDSSGEPVQTSNSVILTHLFFKGAGHTEDHELDPDMIRSTGASRDIWIHKNDFDLTGDSAFDVKVGASAISISFNRVVDVLRATLHGSSDSRTINEQITTTMHHNAFVTRDARYLTLGNTGRRVPLIRRGTSHMWNNVFMNYRKDVLSIRVGASVLWENNALLVNQAHSEKSTLEASLDELSANLLRDIEDGNLRVAGSQLWFANANCELDPSTQRSLSPASGSVDDLAQRYDEASRARLASELRPAGQELIDYVMAAAGKWGEIPFNSPLAASQAEVVANGRSDCQR